MPRRRHRSAAYALVLAAFSLLAASASAGAVERPGEGWIVFPTADVDGAQIVSAPATAGGRRQRTLVFSSALPTPPAPSPNGRLVAFPQWFRGSGALWVMRIDGSRRRRIAKGGDSSPTWSPNGRRLAFIDHLGRLATIRVDGTGRRHVVGRRGVRLNSPLWSPDGGWIAYATSTDELWVVRPDGTGSHRLARSRESNFSWSPDGRRLTYAGADYGDADIFTVSVKGGRAKRLTRNNVFEAVPQWSPDGRRIAFWGESGYTMVVAADGSTRARRVLPGSGPSWSPDGTRLAVRRGDQVWVARADGRAPRRISRGTGVHSGNVEEETGTRAVWTPNGRRVLFARLSYIPGELVAVSPSGGKRRRLTRNRHRELEPAWSPNGRMVAFARPVGRYPADTKEICVIRADGTGFRRLTRGETDSQPTWSPDGRRIVFTRRTSYDRRTGEETTALYRLPAAGGTPTRVTAVTKGHPAWAPGSLIAVDGIEFTQPNGAPAGRATQPPENGFDGQPDWAPDGRRFVFVRFEDPPCRQCEIHYLAIGEIGSDTVRPIQQPEWGFELDFPSWSPDGSRIAAVASDIGLVTIRPDGSERRVLANDLGDYPEIDWGP